LAQVANLRDARGMRFEWLSALSAISALAKSAPKCAPAIHHKCWPPYTARSRLCFVSKGGRPSWQAFASVNAHHKFRCDQWGQSQHEFAL